MKKLLLLLNIVLFVTASNAQVGINTITPSANSVLELNSQFSGGNYGGFMPPRITSAQRDAIVVTSADDGLIAYVTFSDGSRCLQLYNSAKSAWESIKCFDVLTAWLETFGVGTTGGTNVDTYTGYDNYATSTWASTSSTKPKVINTAITSNTAAILTTNPNASGAGYVLFTAAANRDFTIGNINVSTYTGPLSLQLLMYKGNTTSTGSEMTIEYYSGGTWTNVSVTNLPTGTGTDNTWYARTLSTTLPNTVTQLRFTRTTGSGGPEFRIDDIKIFKP